MLSAKRAIEPSSRFTVHEGSRTAENEAVSAALYDELLDRYEHLLSYASNLQSQIRDERMESKAKEQLEAENVRLQHLVQMGEDYIELLEGALGELGVLGRK